MENGLFASFLNVHAKRLWRMSMKLRRSCKLCFRLCCIYLVVWAALRPLPVCSVSRIDRCIHYSGAKSFVNNGLHESFLGPWLQRETRVPRKSSRT